MPDFDIFLNIIKRPESILYRSRVGPSSANIAYVGSLPLSSDNNISIEDTSGTLGPNRVVEDIRIYNDEDSFSQATDSFLLTDVFSKETKSSPKKPLFLQHKFKQFQTGDAISKVRIYDNLFQEVTTTELVIKETEGAMYSNLGSYYNVIPDQKADPEGIEYIYYYVTYNIKRNDNTTVYRELLNNLPIFREATFEDLDDDLNLDLNAKAYLIDSGLDNFSVTLASPRDFAVDTNENAKLKLLWPTSKDYTDPWHLRVLNGRFWSGVGTNALLYRIASEQFNLQSFNPQIGIKRVEKETPTVITKNIIKVDYEDIVNDSAAVLYIFLRITKGTVTHQFTTHPSSPPYTTWTPGTAYGIKSYDLKTGFIEVEGIELSSTDTIEVDYYYNENYYEFTDKDFNPIRNEEVLNQRVAFYIDPDDGQVSLKHAVFDLNGVGISGGFDTIDLFKHETTTGPLLTEAPPGRLFVLGYVTTGEGSSIGDLTTLDTRIYGGGIKKSYTKEVEEKFPEYDFFSEAGAWDGKPFPGNLNCLVKIPIDGVIEGFNGSVRVKEVKGIIKNHMALGVYPITKAYGPEIKFTSVDISKVTGTSTSTVTANWKAVDNIDYKFYHRDVSTEVWTLGGTVAAAGTPTNTVISMSQSVTLANTNEYYFTVLGVIDVDGTSVEVFTQHVSETDLELKTLGDTPDSLNIIKVKVPDL